MLSMKNKSVALVLLLLVLAASVVWMGMGSDGQVATWTGTDQVLGAEGQATDMTRGTEDAESSESDARDEARIELSALAGDKPFNLRVFSGQRNIPAPGAEVYFLELPRRGNNRGDIAGQHWSERAIREGKRFVADADGRIELPRIEREALITAVRPNEYGYRTINRRHRNEETLVLAADQVISIHVVDDAATGVAKVPVAVHQRVPERRNRNRNRNRRGSQNQPNRPSTRLDLRARRETDEQGLAVVRHFQLYVPNQRRDRWRGRGRGRTEQPDVPPPPMNFQASVMVPLRLPVAEPFASDILPSDPIVLRMPATGTVVLNVTTPAGDPLFSSLTAELRVNGEGGESWNRLSGRNPGRKRQGRGVVEFPFVGLGLWLQPHVWLPDDDFRWDGDLAAGPGQAGERVVVNVPLGAGFSVLTGRLVTIEGDAMPRSRSTFTLSGSSGQFETEDLTVDGEGRFQFLFEPLNNQPPFRLDISSRGAKPQVGAVAELPPLVAGQAKDLGDLEMSGFAVIASGRVVDDRGRAVRNATIRLQKEYLRKPGDQRTQWRNEEFAETRSNREGQYQLLGWAQNGKFRVHTTARNHFDSQSEAWRPGDELDIHLEREAQLKGSVLLPSWMPERGMQVSLESASPPQQRRNVSVRGRRTKKTLSLSRVRSGYYNLVIGLREFKDPVLRVDGIFVEPGQRGDHPAIDELDLQSVLHRFQITAVDGRGELIRDPGSPLVASIYNLDGSSQFVGFSWRRGKTEILSPHPQLEVVQIARGYLTQRVTMYPGESQLRFTKLEPVRVVMAGLREMLGEDAPRVRVTMSLVGESGLPSSLRVRSQRGGNNRNYNRTQLGGSGQAWLQGSDEVLIPLMQDGPYTVSIRLQGEGRRNTATLTLGSVEVYMSLDGSQAVELPVDAEAVKAAMEKIGKKIGH